MPRGFFYPARETELWIPWAMEPEQASGRGDHYLRLVARLKPGTTRSNGLMPTSDPIAQRLSTEYPKTNEGLTFIVNSLQQDYVRRSSFADSDLVCRGRTGAPDRVRERCKPTIGPGNDADAKRLQFASPWALDVGPSCDNC